MANQGKPYASVYSLHFPIDLALDRRGNLYVSDLNNHRVLAYDLPAAGNPAAAYMFGYTPNYDTCGVDPDPDPRASTISLRCPLGLAIDRLGSLFVADFYNNRVLAYDVPHYDIFLSLATRSIGSQ
jgi:sugar lactone lactonase YvrE